MKRFFVFAVTLVTLLGLNACNADDASTAADTSPTSTQKDAGNVGHAANCKAYVTAVRGVCLDSITRGLDMSCNNQMIALDTVREQAAGNLFDVGSKAKNAEVVESVCENYLDSLKEDRQTADAGMTAEGSAGPECAALAKTFESQCLDSLGSGPLPDGCRKATRFLSMTSVPIEGRCELASGGLK